MNTTKQSKFSPSHSGHYTNESFSLANCNSRHLKNMTEITRLLVPHQLVDQVFGVTP